MFRTAVLSLMSALFVLTLGANNASALINCGADCDYPEPVLPLCTSVCTTSTLCSKGCGQSTAPGDYEYSTCGTFGVCAKSTTTTTTPPPGTSQTICSTQAPTSAYSVNKSASKSESFGSSFVGASYAVSASLVGTGATSSTPTTIKTAANLAANASLFWKTFQLAKGDFQSTVKTGVSATGSLALYIVGIVNYSTTFSQPLTVTKSFSKTFFSAQHTVSILGFPITVKGSVAGSAGFTLAGGPTLSGGTASFTPFAKAYATASASVGALGVGAGVSGTITMVELTAPAVLDAYFASGNLGWSISLKAVLKTLAGSLKVFVEYIFDSSSWTIFSWSGYSKTYTIIDQKGCTKLLPSYSTGTLSKL